MSQNVYELDASNLDETNGSIVPIDVLGDDEGHALDRVNAVHWTGKIVNNADVGIDFTPVVSTEDDPTLSEYDTVDALAGTVSTGSVPDNVETFDTDYSVGYVGIELTPTAAATGTVKVVFQSREMG